MKSWRCISNNRRHRVSHAGRFPYAPYPNGFRVRPHLTANKYHAIRHPSSDHTSNELPHRWFANPFWKIAQQWRRVTNQESVQSDITGRAGKHAIFWLVNAVPCIMATITMARPSQVIRAHVLTLKDAQVPKSRRVRACASYSIPNLVGLLCAIA